LGFYLITSNNPTTFVSRRKSSRKFSGAGGQPGNPTASENNDSRQPPSLKIPSAGSSSARKLRVAQTADGCWEFVHPRCALKRQEDIEEVDQMIAAGEAEIARDELRWLLAECHDFLVAHKLLGDLALAASDFRLARGHYGYAFQIGIKAIDSAQAAKSFPYGRSANQAFFQSGRGLAICLSKLGKQRLARDVIAKLLQLDASDALGLRELLNDQRGRNQK
jgi:hypothetical protein